MSNAWERPDARFDARSGRTTVRAGAWLRRRSTVDDHGGAGGQFGVIVSSLLGDAAAGLRFCRSGQAQLPTAALPAADGRIQLMAASHKVAGTRSPGQGCVIAGTGEVVTSGEFVDLVREKFPWARGALVVCVESVATQL